MAKKKSVKKSKKKGQGQVAHFLLKTKQFLIGVAAVILLFIATIYVYDYFFPTQAPQPVKREAEKKQPKPSKAPAPSKPVEPTVASVKVPNQVEIPQLKKKRKEQVIQHTGYTVSYNADYRIANWVAYELTAEEVNNKKVERSNKFVSDPDVKGATATNEDYTRSGYDRGHLAPAADMKWSAKAMRESFYLSNICPQIPGLNRGVWNDLEGQCRMWAKDNGSLYIVTGPVISEDMKLLGKNRVAIPNAFYKVIVYHTGKQYKGIGFLFDNKDYNESLSKSMAVPIDRVEKVTGIDFFPAIPDEEEEAMEKAVDWSSWSF